MAKPSELGLQLLAAAQELDPDWEDPPEGTPVRSLVVQGLEDDEVLALSVEVGDVRYWARWNDPAFGQDTTWKQAQRQGCQRLEDLGRGRLARDRRRPAVRAPVN
jgi:hypothetical protein